MTYPDFLVLVDFYHGTVIAAGTAFCSAIPSCPSILSLLLSPAARPESTPE